MKKLNKPLLCSAITISAFSLAACSPFDPAANITPTVYGPPLTAETNITETDYTEEEASESDTDEPYEIWESDDMQIFEDTGVIYGLNSIEYVKQGTDWFDITSLIARDPDIVDSVYVEGHYEFNAIVDPWVDIFIRFNAKTLYDYGCQHAIIGLEGSFFGLPESAFDNNYITIRVPFQIKIVGEKQDGPSDGTVITDDNIWEIREANEEQRQKYQQLME